MAASGFVEEKCCGDETDGIPVKNGYELIEMVHKNGIFSHTFACTENSTLCGTQNGSAIAKCLERLNGLDKVNGSVPSAITALGSYLKNSVTQAFHLRSRNDRSESIFHSETRGLRLGRVPSTDSVAVSSAGSEHGSIDSCQSSSNSNASDTASVSAPCSPEGLDSPRPGTPQPMPPISPSLADSPHDSCDESNIGLGLTTSRTDSCQTQKENKESQDNCLPQPDTDVCDTTNSHFYTERLCEQDLCRSSTTSSPFTCDVAEQHVCSITSDSESSHIKAERRHVEIHRNSVCESDSKIRSSDSGRTVHFKDIGICSANQSSSESLSVFCKWVNCHVEVQGSTELVEHIRSQHVETQTEQESFTCLWTGCKVYDRPSCSLSWLERHVLSHGGSKPFKCIVDSCSVRFTSQAALERHVNSHFNNGSSLSAGAKVGRTKDDTPTKLIKKKKLRYRRRCMAVKTEDFFDARIMEHIRYGLLEMNALTQLDTYGYPGAITFYSRVLAKRTEESGKVKVLLHWTPENMLPDSWVPESSVSPYCTIPVTSLPRDALTQLDPLYTGQVTSPTTKRKRK